MRDTTGRKKFFLSFFVAVFILVSGIPCSADYSATGTVSGPYPYTHTVKCIPGDSFTVSVKSEHPTSVDVLFMTPSGNEWAFNSVTGSDKRTSHELRHTAPAGKPENNAEYHHYKISILASTDRQTRFSLNIKQYSDGSKNDPQYIKAAAVKLEKLAVALDKEKKRIGLEVKNLMVQVKNMDAEIDMVKKRIQAGRAELDTLKNRYQNETDKSIKSSIAIDYERRREQINAVITQSNNLASKRNSLMDRTKTYMEPWNEIEALEKNLVQAWKLQDIDQCVLIANGSRLAQSLGWQPMKRK